MTFDPHNIRAYPSLDVHPGLRVYGSDDISHFKYLVESAQEEPGTLIKAHTCGDLERPFVVRSPNGEDIRHYEFIYIAEDYKDDV